ncbi:MAG: SBBP repeat-containing protein [Candidatus Hodarchaeales archaeon]
MKIRKVLIIMIFITIFLTTFLTGQQVIGSEGEGNLQLTYSSYFGGSNKELSWSFTYDDENNVYLTGVSESIDFPTTSNAYMKEKPSSSPDVFVSKFSKEGSTLLFSTWLGPAGHDAFATGFRDLPNIALDSSNNIIISGTTKSDDFPTTTDSYNQSRSGGKDNFLSILSSDGSNLIYSTYFGGSDDENSGGLSVDHQDNIYISGSTLSNDFPVTTGAYDESHNGDFDMFISKFSSSGTTLEYSTYLGGIKLDQTFATELAFDSSNNLIIAGSTRSEDFPITPDAYDDSYGGGLMIPPGSGKFCCGDVIISKISENGSNLSYSTFLGGDSGEKPHGLVIDDNDNIYVTGSTRSTDFPTTSNAYDKSYGGDDSVWNFFGDIFVTKLNVNGGTIDYSTFIGGTGYDLGESITLDNSNQVIIAGTTQSENFPLKGEVDSTQTGNEIVMLKLSADGSSITNSTYLGGLSNDNGGHIEMDNLGNVILIGYTESPDFPVSSNAWHDSLEGSRDIYIVKFGEEPSQIINNSESATSPSFLVSSIFIGLVFLGRKSFKKKN